MSDVDEMETSSISLPSTNIMSKILLQDNRVMDIIIKSLLDTHVASSMYSLGRCEWPNKSVSDVVYLPKTENCEDLPPILVVVQNTINAAFMAEVIKYCISLYEKYQVLPSLLIISVEGYSSEVIKAKFKIIEGIFLAEANCKFWAKHCFVLSRESILNFLNEDPLNKLVALGYFVTDSMKSLESHDPTIRLLFDIVEEKLNDQ